MAKTMQQVVAEFAERKARIADIDAEINGGALVEVGRIIGRPLYVRVDHNDPERARYDVDEIRSILQSVFLDPIAPKAEVTVEEYATEHRISVQTVRRWIKAGKLNAYKFGKSYRIKP